MYFILTFNTYIEKDPSYRIIIKAKSEKKALNKLVDSKLKNAIIAISTFILVNGKDVEECKDLYKIIRGYADNNTFPEEYSDLYRDVYNINKGGLFSLLKVSERFSIIPIDMIK